MLKKRLAWLLAMALISLPMAQTSGAKPQDEKRAFSPEEVKIQVTRLGTGEKARATIELKSGAKTKGYVSQIGPDDFTIRDRKTNAPTTIRYDEVSRVKPDKGHSKARNLGLGIAIGAGAFLGILLAVFASIDD